MYGGAVTAGGFGSSEWVLVRHSTDLFPTVTLLNMGSTKPLDMELTDLEGSFSIDACIPACIPPTNSGVLF